MAILSNGKFYGFLCSAKETGQKLANGAKEYVENFVSGFAGHGWKIWEYVKGKWMLEIDSIRVRGQFTVFEMLISKVRAIIGAQAITQGCGKIKTAELSEDGTAYLITLEDADMSFMEHDFIRCQEFTGGQKVYHVEIESVADGIIRVPLSEFDLDEEGITLNPPAPGDDIVQFGNSSHDEKYVGRHSAIYMHADEGLQPAIDVLDGIYSKDWSSCLKVRMGGDLPGTNGAKGLYCVNGKLLFADEVGETVSVINPDGSASFARGKLSWTKDGSPKFSGTILVNVDKDNVWEVNELCQNIIGNKNGKKIIINGVNANIEIYNNANELVNLFEGNSYGSIDDLYSGSLPKATTTSDLIIFTLKGKVDTTLSDSKNINIIKEDYFYIDSNINMNFNFNCTLQNYIGSFNDGHCVTGYELHLLTYKNISEQYVSDIIISRNSKDDSGTETIYMFNGAYLLEPNFYYKLIFKLYATTTSGKSVSLSEVTITDLKIVFTKNGYLSRFFANGFALGTSTKNIFAAYNTHNPITGNQMNFDIYNDYAGIKITNTNLYIKRYVSETTNIMGLVPVYIAMGRMANASSYTPYFYDLNTFDSRDISIYKLSTGRYRLDFPSQWSQYNFHFYCYILVTPFSTINDTNRIAYMAIESFTQSYVVIVAQQNGSYVDSEFFFEIKLY